MTQSTSGPPWKKCGALAITLAGLAVAVRATAQPSGPEPTALVLRWTAPSECPTRDEVLQDTRSLVVHSAAAPKTPVTVDAVVERLAEDRWVLTLAIGAAQQKVEASSCTQLARAGALFLALILDPSQDAPPLGPTSVGPTSDGPTSDAGAPPPSAAAPTPPPTRTPTPEPAPAPAPLASPRQILVLAAAGVMADVGTLPRAGPLGILEVGLRYRRLDMSLQGTAGPPQDNTVSGTAGSRLQPFSASLTPCLAAVATSRFRLGPCGWVEVGVLHAAGIGILQSRTTDAPWFSLGGNVDAWLRLDSNFEVRLSAGVLAPVVRPDFELSGLGQVFQQGVAMRAGTAAVLRF